jgi:MFS family permease
VPSRHGQSSRVGLLAPLSHRDFALLWSGISVSLVGDGVYFVAIAWEAYRLSNAPSALSLVGVAWMLPTVLCLLFGGLAGDRFDRRHVILAGLCIQAATISSIAGFALADAMTLWWLLALVAIYGAAQAFVAPTLEATIPTLVPADQLVAASALDRFSRPMALQIIGPAVGGIVVEATSLADAFLLDAATFLLAAGSVLMIRLDTSQQHQRPPSRPGREIGEGLRFVRGHPWLWITLLAAGLTLLIFTGPAQILVPFLVKNKLHGGAATFAAIRAAGGVGALTGALAIGQAGLPRSFPTWMYAAWALQSLALVGYALSTRAWVLAAISLMAGALKAVGDVIWGAMIKTLVPNELLGRVSSLDWMVSIALVPLSFALAAPISSAIGLQSTMIIAGTTAAATMFTCLIAPSVRQPEAWVDGAFRLATVAR